MAGQWEGAGRRPAPQAHGSRGTGGSVQGSHSRRPRLHCERQQTDSRWGTFAPAWPCQPRLGPHTSADPKKLMEADPPLALRKQEQPPAARPTSPAALRARWGQAHEKPSSRCMLILSTTRHHLHFRGEAGSGSQLPREATGFGTSSPPGHWSPHSKPGPGGAFS